MTTVDRSLGDGVFYAPSDYVGLWPRLVILIVDTLVLVVGLGARRQRISRLVDEDVWRVTSP